MRILWIKSGPLHPADTGGRIRSLGMLRGLHKEHEVVYLAMWPEGTPEESRQFADFASSAHWVNTSEVPAKESGKLFPLLQSMLTSRLPYVAWAYRSTALIRKIENLHAEAPLDLIVCDFLFPSWSCLRARFPNKPPMVLFQHNVESMIWKRRYESESNLRKWVAHHQWQRLHKYEAQACARFDGVITVSEEDSRLHRELYGLCNVLGDVPTGVDLEYFASLVNQPRDQLPFLAFVGSMDWAANVDGIREFCRLVWPHLHAQWPELRLKIIGRRPVASVRALAQLHPGVEVTGTVDDVRPHLSGASAMLVPLRIGGGTRLKIYEAMAAGIPVISTRIGAEGLPMKKNEEILLAEDIAQLREPVLQLLADVKLGERIAAAALVRVRREFGWDAAAQAFISLAGKLLK